MSKLKIGKYLCISWMVLATALIAHQSYKLSEIENHQNSQYTTVSTSSNVAESNKVNRTGEFE